MNSTGAPRGPTIAQLVQSEQEKTAQNKAKLELVVATMMDALGMAGDGGSAVDIDSLSQGDLASIFSNSATVVSRRSSLDGQAVVSQGQGTQAAGRGRAAVPTAGSRKHVNVSTGKL